MDVLAPWDIKSRVVLTRRANLDFAKIPSGGAFFTSVFDGEVTVLRARVGPVDEPLMVEQGGALTKKKFFS